MTTNDGALDIEFDSDGLVPKRSRSSGKSDKSDKSDKSGKSDK